MITAIKTARLHLVPTVADHDRLFAEALGDPELYRFLPTDPCTAAQWRERLLRWEARRSTDGSEHWWNWIAFDEAGAAVGHFQITLDATGTAVLGYVLASTAQRQGYATEALRSLIEWVPATRVRAAVDTRNARSSSLLERIGLKKICLVEHADHFKGSDSHEWVYELLKLPT